MMPEEKPHQPKKETKPPRLAEMQQNLEDYANDLRKIIEKLRRKLDRLNSGSWSFMHTPSDFRSWVNFRMFI
jgi:hypothetical protein